MKFVKENKKNFVTTTMLNFINLYIIILLFSFLIIQKNFQLKQL